MEADQSAAEENGFKLPQKIKEFLTPLNIGIGSVLLLLVIGWFYLVAKTFCCSKSSDDPSSCVNKEINEKANGPTSRSRKKPTTSKCTNNNVDRRSDTEHREFGDAESDLRNADTNCSSVNNPKKQNFRISHKKPNDKSVCGYSLDGIGINSTGLDNEEELGTNVTVTDIPPYDTDKSLYIADNASSKSSPKSSRKSSSKSSRKSSPKSSTKSMNGDYYYDYNTRYGNADNGDNGSMVAKKSKSHPSVICINDQLDSKTKNKQKCIPTIPNCKCGEIVNTNDSAPDEEDDEQLSTLVYYSDEDIKVQQVQPGSAFNKSERCGNNAISGIQVEEVFVKVDQSTGVHSTGQGTASSLQSLPTNQTTLILGGIRNLPRVQSRSPPSIVDVRELATYVPRSPSKSRRHPLPIETFARALASSSEPPVVASYKDKMSNDSFLRNMDDKEGPVESIARQIKTSPVTNQNVYNRSNQIQAQPTDRRMSSIQKWVAEDSLFQPKSNISAGGKHVQKFIDNEPNSEDKPISSHSPTIAIQLYKTLPTNDVTSSEQTPKSPIPAYLSAGIFPMPQTSPRAHETYIQAPNQFGNQNVNRNISLEEYCANSPSTCPMKSMDNRLTANQSRPYGPTITPSTGVSSKMPFQGYREVSPPRSNEFHSTRKEDHSNSPYIIAYQPTPLEIRVTSDSDSPGTRHFQPSTSPQHTFIEPMNSSGVINKASGSLTLPVSQSVGTLSYPEEMNVSNTTSPSSFSMNNPASGIFSLLNSNYPVNSTYSTGSQIGTSTNPPIQNQYSSIGSKFESADLNSDGQFTSATYLEPIGNLASQLTDGNSINSMDNLNSNLSNHPKSRSVNRTKAITHENNNADMRSDPSELFRSIANDSRFSQEVSPTYPNHRKQPDPKTDDTTFKKPGASSSLLSEKVPLTSSLQSEKVPSTTSNGSFSKSSAVDQLDVNIASVNEDVITKQESSLLG